jgi:hypothetical protein
MVIQLQVRKHGKDYTAMNNVNCVNPLLRTARTANYKCDIFPSNHAKTFLEEKPATTIIRVKLIPSRRFGIAKRLLE